MPLVDSIIQMADDDVDDKCPPERNLEQIPESVRGVIDQIVTIRFKPDKISEAISASIPPPIHPPTAREYDQHKFLEMHQWMGIPTRALHTAVGLMDLCAQIQPIACQDYQTLAMAALITAALQWQSGFKVDLVKLSEVTVDEMDPQQTRKACNYIFDLGLQDERLCRYSASLRCAAVLYLIRYILRRKCNCSRSKSGGGKCCHFRSIPLWSETLAKFTSHHNTPILRRVAAIYLDALMFVQQYGVQYYQRSHLSSPNSVC
ncbi:unnamed protein product [Hydatigera taeniaeformis]|uniref:Cyclin_C domain-containing protein n=1 Tax=Hydatigena taeniaeformis TaxID=6205 RepID=A0A0R3WRN4_HYDTA|nr:unnamed protein product [Hydatigera taeniaeformis]